MSERALVTKEGREPTATTGAGRLYGLLVEFEDVATLKAAARRVRAAGFTKWDAHSPFPVHGIDEAMGIRHTRLPWVVFVSGICGLIVGLGMQWYLNATDPLEFGFLPAFVQGYDYRVSGKPLWSLPANIPVIFEMTVLLAAAAAVIGMLAMNGLPRWHQALFSSARFRRVTADRFFICIEAQDPRFDPVRTNELLAALGGSDVERVYQPQRSKLPGWVPTTTVIVLCLALFPPLLAYKANVSKSSRPRIHPIQDMDNQQKYKPQQAAPGFADGRAMRPAVPGTIARGDDWALGTDEHLFGGKMGGRWATTFPPQIEIAEPLLRRGQRQFNIYCAACHGLDGSGNGIVAQRVREKAGISTGWVPPTPLLGQTVRQRPVGHIYSTITNGIRTMPPYGDQIPIADRWAIIAYIRALERSQNASIADVPAELRSALRQE